MGFTRRLRAPGDLSSDPRLPYMIGHLAGAGEMAAHWMSLKEDAETQAMGRKLGEAVAWFFVNEDHPSE